MPSEVDSTQQNPNKSCLENKSWDCYVYDVPEGSEFRCDICDVVYHSKEEYEINQKSLFHKINMEKKGRGKGCSQRKSKSLHNRPEDAVVPLNRYNFRSHDGGRTQEKNITHPRRGSWRGNKHNSTSHKKPDSYRKGSYENSQYGHFDRCDQWDGSYENSQFSKWQACNVTWFDDTGMPDESLMGVTWNKDCQPKRTGYSWKAPAFPRKTRNCSNVKKAAFVPPFSGIPFPLKVTSESSSVTSTASSLTAVSPSSILSGNIVTSSITSAVSSTTQSPPLDTSLAQPSTAVSFRQGTKSASESDGHTKDSQSAELSLKASEIIDSILRGEKVPSRSLQTTNSHSSGDDIVDRAEKLCQKLRAEREQAKQKHENTKQQITEDANRQKLMNSVQRTRENGSSSGSGSGSTSGKSFPAATSNCSDKSPPRDGSLPKPAIILPSSHNSQRLQVSKSVSLKEGILRMLRFPKSRRGTSQIERMLQQSKVPDSSRLRLINLMKPLSEPEKPQLDFLQLAPDVQQHILSLVDEVMMEMELEDDVVMIDEAKQESSLFHHPDDAPASSRKRQVSISEQNVPSVSGDLADIPDVKHHFDDLLTGTAVLQAVSDSTGHDDVKDTASPTITNVHQHNGSQQSNLLPSVVIKREQFMNSSDSIIENPSHKSSVRCGGDGISDETNGAADVTRSMARTSDVKVSTSGVPDVQIDTSGTSVVRDNLTDVTPRTSVIGVITSISLPVESGTHDTTKVTARKSDVSNGTPVTSDVGIASGAKTRKSDQSDRPSKQTMSNSVSQSSGPSGGVTPEITRVKAEPTDKEYDKALGSVSCDKVSSKKPSTPVNVAVDKLFESVVMDTTEETGIGAKTIKSKKPRTKRPRKSPGSNKSSGESAVAKRQKINDPDEPDANNMVDELYNIAVEEDEIREKMTETDNAIKELQELLDATKARLEHRQKYKRELEERETFLRKRRMDLLKDARSSTRRTSVESLSSLPSEGSTKNKKNKKPRMKQKPTKDDADVSVEPDTTVNNSSNVMKTDAKATKEQKKTTKSVKPKAQRKSSVGDVDIEKAADMPKVDTSVPDIINPENTPGNMSIKYLGSFLGGGDVQTLLKHLSQNFKNLKPVTELDLGDGVKVDLVEMGSSSKKVSSTVKEGNSTSATPTSGNNTGQFKQLKTVAAAPIRSKKAMKKKNKTPVNVSLDSESEVDAKPKQKKTLKKKKKDKGTSKIIKEYLHCSSSSDVDLDGPQESNGTKTRMAKLTSKTQLSDYNSEDSDSSDDAVEYIPLDPDRKLNKKSKSAVEGVFSEILRGPVTCLVSWRRYLLATGQDTHVRYLIKNKPHDAPTRILCNHIDQIKVLHVSGGQNQNGSVYLYTGSLDKSLVISNFSTGVYMSQHQCSAPIRCGSAGWGKLYLGLDDGTLVTFDIQRYHIEHSYPAANSAIVQIATGQEGARHLICICEQHQSSITLRDARNKLFIRSLDGHTKTPAVIKVKNHLVYSGGADNMVQIHNIVTGNMESLLRFQSAVTQIVVSNVLVVGEKRGLISVIQHKDQVRERVIYTYDQSPVTALLFEKPHNMLYIGEESGRLEAVSLGTKSFKCQFSLCSGYAFGQRTHMVHHLITDHVEPCIKGKVYGIDVEQLPHIFKCLWKSCQGYIYIKNSAKEAEEHMSCHVNEVFDDGSDK